MAPLSALVDCMVAGSPSIGSAPLMVSSRSFVAVTHAPVPIPFFTDASDAPMRVPCFKAVAKLAGCPVNLAGPVIQLHVSLMLALYLVPTSSIVTSLVEVPQNIQQFLDSDVREILVAL